MREPKRESSARFRHEAGRPARYGGPSLDAERIFAGLNPEQRAAVEATRGPVCILAGAGTGKTTTITRRIAWQVASGAFAAPELVAVTFTDKAAGELRARLAALGVEGVRASTFHSAALALLRRFAGDPGRILSTKALLLRQIGNRLPAPYKFRPAGDLATEIEWAKNRRLTPQTYIAALGDHEPPLPADLAHRVFREYEKRKAEAGALDFEDLLERTIQVLEADPHALELVRERWQAFTVDEYQDVNLLQQTLLDLWLGDRDELCAVGDDYQSIYGFTGASAQWLLAPAAAVCACPRRSARAELPVDAAGARACEPARAEARWCGEDIARDARRRARARRRAERRRSGSHQGARDCRRRARGSGRARANERPSGRFRGVVPRGRHPVPGCVAPRARRGSAAAEGGAA